MAKIGNRRATFIDYKKPGIFMITMNKLQGVPPFSKLVKNPYEPDKYKSVRPDYSDIGFIIFKNLKNLKENNSGIIVRQYIIMPDHLHFILEITKELDTEVGNYLAIFKRNIFKEAIELKLMPSSLGTVFEKGFNDQYLRFDRSLDGFYQYIKKNPYNLWIRLQNPDFFRRKYGHKLFGVECDLYGNIQFLENPFIESVIVHRSDSAQIRKQKLELWRYTYQNGGILIGAFISPHEREIFKEALSFGGKIIRISNRGFAKREKPSEGLLSYCEKGQLLIISPRIDFIPYPERRPVRREECLFMNNLALRIAAQGGN